VWEAKDESPRRASVQPTKPLDRCKSAAQVQKSFDSPVTAGL